MSRTQLFHAKKIVVVYSAVMLCIMSIIIFSSVAKADTEIPSYIYASYSGSSVVVGEEIDLEKLTVTAVYADGTTVPVTAFSLSTDTIKKEGLNEISIIYMGRSTIVSIIGKQTKELFAFYMGQPVSIGNAIDKREVYLQATYSDGTSEIVTDFEIFTPVIETIGKNTVRAMYGGVLVSFTVDGVVPKEVSTLYVTYTGEDVMIGKKIDRNKIFVTATYVDGTSETIMNYMLSTDTPTMIGNNTIVVSYNNKTATFSLNGIERTVETLVARYTGTGVEVGKAVRPSDIWVKATYTDGTSEVVTDFTLPSPVIYFVGAHVKTVHYMGLTADIYVIGVEEMPTSYENALTFTVSNGIQEATCILALPDAGDKDYVTCESMRNTYVSQVVTRAVRKSRFITFNLEIDDEIEDKLPAEMKILVPAGFDPEYCGLYYTPNRKTVIGKMNTEINDDGEMMVMIHKSGTYILSYDPE